MVLLLRAILGLWGPFNSWSNEDLVRARTASSVRHVESALREYQREVRTFQLRALREVGVNLKASEPIEVYPRSYVDVFDVYQRPARDYIETIENGGASDEAWEAFEKRLNGIIESDVAITERNEVENIWDELEDAGLMDWQDDGPLHDDDNPDELMSRDDMEALIENELELDEEDPDDEDESESRSRVKVLGYRRVIRPELSMHGACGLCVVAATQWYTRGDLKAIHARCKCIVLPVTKEEDPGTALNRDDLRQSLDFIYASAGGNTRNKLKRIRVAVRDHGELGSTLTYSAKRGWQPKPYYRPYRKPTATDQQLRLEKRLADLNGTVENLRAQLERGEGDPAGVRHAIWETEQVIRDVAARVAR